MSTMLIPYADNFNHSAIDVAYEVINTDLHGTYNSLKKQYYTKEKLEVDYSIIKCTPKSIKPITKTLYVDSSMYKLEIELGKDGIDEFLKGESNNIWNM